jgi:hypothetical protein
MIVVVTWLAKGGVVVEVSVGRGVLYVLGTAGSCRPGPGKCNPGTIHGGPGGELKQVAPVSGVVKLHGF